MISIESTTQINLHSDSTSTATFLLFCFFFLGNRPGNIQSDGTYFPYIVIPWLLPPESKGGLTGLSLILAECLVAVDVLVADIDQYRVFVGKSTHFLRGSGCRSFVLGLAKTDQDRVFVRM
jgi:hypothetical protein